MMKKPRRALTSTIISELFAIGTVAEPDADFPIEYLGEIAQVMRLTLGEIEAAIEVRRETCGGRG